MKVNTKELLEKIFPPFQLGNNRSLFECDFYDTHYGYFDQIDDDYLSAIEISAEDLILEYGFDWPEFYTKVGLEAVHSRSRPLEGIKTWKDVSYEYLYYFGQNCVYLSSEGFKFFLPAALYYLLSTDENKTYMDSFIFRLNSQWEKDQHVFDDDQKSFILTFVRDHYSGLVSLISNP